MTTMTTPSIQLRDSARQVNVQQRVEALRFGSSGSGPDETFLGDLNQRFCDIQSALAFVDKLDLAVSHKRFREQLTEEVKQEVSNRVPEAELKAVLLKPLEGELTNKNYVQAAARLIPLLGNDKLIAAYAVLFNAMAQVRPDVKEIKGLIAQNVTVSEEAGTGIRRIWSRPAPNYLKEALGYYFFKK